MSETQSYNDEIRLVNLSPGTTEDPIEIQYIQSTLKSTPSYIACALLIDESNDTSSISSQNLPPGLEDLLRSIRHPDTPLCIWAEQLCIDQESYEDKERHVLILRDIYIAADRVVIWAGNDHEADHDDHLDVYMGSGNTSFTEHAFQFASRLSEAAAHEIAGMLDNRYPSTDVHSWAYLFRILCRPFFRGLPLLRTNYASQIRSATVRCSQVEITLSELLEAAARIWAIFPVPYFIREMNIPDDVEDENQRKSFAMEVDRGFLLSCIRFGWHPPEIAASISRPLEKNTDDNWSSTDRFACHLGWCDEIYDMKDREHIFNKARARFQSQEADPERYISAALERRRLQRPPSLPCEAALSPAPRASDQAPFIHFPIKRGYTILLLKLFPASSLSAPIQCGYAEPRLKEAPPFYFVANSTAHRTLLPAKDYFGVKFPVTTRQTVPILVSGQAFIVPRFQEIFLRLIRQEKDPTYLFMWNLCMYPHEAIRTRDHLNLYTQVKAMVKIVGKAEELDMYNVLDRAGQERSRLDLDSLGLPTGMSWDEWLLEIND